MAETTDQVRSEIARTRNELGLTIDELTSEIDARITRTKRNIPFWGMSRRQSAAILGTSAGVVLLAFTALASRRQKPF